MGESVITVDAEGRIDYINHAAETLLGQSFDQVVGKSFADVASLVDETDRRSLGDPVRKALSHRRPRHHGQARGAGARERRARSARSRSA